MKFSILRLGTSVYFEGSQRDNIVDTYFDIEFNQPMQGFILTGKKSKERHYISIYNVAYAKIIEENDSLKETKLVTDRPAEMAQDAKSTEALAAIKGTRKERSKKD
jgi:hypothetical protein